MENKLSFVDLKVLYIGIINGGQLDEATIENSELKKLGTGKTLDLLASLRDRGLIEMSQNKFVITKKGQETMWDKKTPLWIRILRILEIKPLEIYDIAKYLNESEEDIISDIEQLRKEHLVIITPLKENGRLKKIYEIMQEGKEKILETKYENNDVTRKTKLLQIVNEIIYEVNQTTLNEIQKEKIIEKLHKIKKISRG